MRDFQKDVFAIALGGFFGALFAHSLGAYWPLGLICGGTVGYLARLLTEPARIIRSASTAWTYTANWKPRPDWKKRIEYGFRTGITFGGVFGLVMGSTVAIVGAKESGLYTAFLAYLMICGFSNIIFTALSVFFEYGNDHCHAPNKNDLWMARNLNSIVIHYTIVVYALKGFRFILRNSPRFVRVFAVLVHSDRFTACGAYALFGATTVFFFISANPLMMATAALIWAIIGAMLRRIVLKALLPRHA